MLDTDLLFGPIVTSFLILVSTVLLYWYSTHTFDYFKKRNIPYVKPLPLLGSILDVVRKPIHDIENQRRQKYGRIYGHFEGLRPVLSVADPTLLRDILVKDFHIFPQRRLISTGDEIFDKMLSAVNGEDWKRIRTIVTPTFTTGKIRRMINIFKECAATSIQNFKKDSENGDPVELKR
ncbi:cytochrome P450 3A6, partial [Trichonephila clavata]